MCQERTPNGNSAQQRRGADLAALAWLAVLAAGLYANALRNPFIIDDQFLILGDQRVQAFHPAQAFSQEYWPLMGNRLYRPLTTLSLVLNWAISQHPWAFRLPNLLLYIGAGFLLHLLVRDLTGSSWAGLVAATFFIVHPLHTGPLNCIVDRAELLVGFFGLLALWLAWRDLSALSTGRSLRPLLAALAFAAAVFSKEHALTLLGVVPLLELYARRARLLSGVEHTWRRSLHRYLPLALVAVGYLITRVIVLGSLARPALDVKAVDNIVAHPEYGLQPGDSVVLARWGTPLAVAGLAGRLLVWPHPLSFDYSYAAIDSVRRASDPRLWLGAGLLLIAVLVLGWSYQRRSPVFFGLGFVLLTYSLVSNTYVVIGTVFAERFLYFPSAGWCLLVGLLASAAWKHVQARRARATVGSAAVILIVLAVALGWYGWLTVARNRDYHSEAALKAADQRAYPRSARLLAGVGWNALEAGQPELALKYAQQAMAIAPEISTAWRVAGCAYYQVGQPEQALAHLMQSFQLGWQDERSVTLACDLLVARGEYRRAIGILARFLEDFPASPDAHNNLAWYLMSAEPVQLRDLSGARRHIEVALRLAPRVPDYVDTYVAVLLALDQRAAAIQALERLLPGIPPGTPGRDELDRQLAELQANRSPASSPAPPPDQR